MILKKVHFLGIAGSGMSACAVLAKKAGFVIGGCDIKDDSPYLSNIRKEKIPVSVGHSGKHLKSCDLVVTTPAAFFSKESNEELKNARKKNILLTWQGFMSKYLMTGKDVVCIAGTHGKSTTTALASLIFEKAKMDPSVMIGAEVAEWQANFRFGNGDLFIAESDEFYDNFLNYKPNVVILNNIEFDHPDYFKDEPQLMKSFYTHIRSLQGRKVLIINQDSKGIKDLLDLYPQTLKGLDVYGYTLSKSPLISLKKSLTAYEIDLKQKVTKFKVKSDYLFLKDTFDLKIPGNYNVSNSLGVILLAWIYKLPLIAVKDILKKFDGIERRLELIGQRKGVFVYDDYAHHPTAVRVTLEALRQKHPKKKIIAICEPHSFSRTKALLKEYKGAFEDADNVIIAPIFKARDSSGFGVSSQSIVEISGHKNIKAMDSFEKIVEDIIKNLQKNDVVIVMGAGDSYKLTKNILDSLK